MKRITAKLSDEQREWVEQQAEQRDRSQAEIMRAAVDLARGEPSVLRNGAQHSEVNHSDAQRSESNRIDVHHDDALRDRVDTLEQRVDDLEDRVPDRESDETDGLDQGQGQDSGSDLEDALTGWDPGRNPVEREERRESGLAVLEWVREQDRGVKAADVKHALYEDHGVDGQSEQTWWEQTAREALSHAAERGYIDSSGVTYEWES